MYFLWQYLLVCYEWKCSCDWNVKTACCETFIEQTTTQKDRDNTWFGMKQFVRQLFTWLLSHTEFTLRERVLKFCKTPLHSSEFWVVLINAISEIIIISFWGSDSNDTFGADSKWRKLVVRSGLTNVVVYSKKNSDSMKYCGGVIRKELNSNVNRLPDLMKICRK